MFTQAQCHLSLHVEVSLASSLSSASVSQGHQHTLEMLHQSIERDLINTVVGELSTLCPGESRVQDHEVTSVY